MLPWEDLPIEGKYLGSNFEELDTPWSTRVQMCNVDLWIWSSWCQAIHWLEENYVLYVIICS